MVWKPDPDCRICKGSGTLIENERVTDGEYWCSFVDCECTWAAKDIAQAHSAYADYLANGGTSLEDLKRELEIS